MNVVMKALVYWVGTALCVVGLAVLLSGPSQDERRQTARNVERLVAESRLNRELLCLVALRDPQSTAWANRRIIQICVEVGVRP